MPPASQPPDDRWPYPLGEIPVWFAAADQHRPHEQALRALLTDDEAARADRYVFEKDRLAFVVGRAALRSILGRFLLERPRNVTIVANAFGKPLLETGALRFNVSHSGNVVLIAVHRDHEIGVDVERIRPLDDWESLEAQYFSAREVNELRRYPLVQRPAAFFACWTRKEAYVKARGEGLSRPLNEFDVVTFPERAARWELVRGEDPSRWYVHDLPVPNEYAGAIVAPVPGLRVQYRRWRTDALPEAQ